MKNKLFITLALLLVFSTTALAQNVIPMVDGQSYIEDFDSGTMEGWTVEATGAGTWAIMNGGTSNSMAFQNAETGDEARLISPIFDMSSIGSATFSFRYTMMALYPPYDVLTVSYRSSETDPWHTLDSYSVSDWANVFDATFDLPDISATYQISFLGHSNGGYYIFIDDIEIAPAGGCARPMNLEAIEVTAFSTLLGWSTTGNEERWTLEMNGHSRTIETQPFLVEGLEPQTEYTFRVKAQCNNDLESEWSFPLTIKTLCDVILVTNDEPYFDDFEGSEEFVCWQDEISSGDGGWTVDPGYTILNNTAFFIWLNEEALLYSAPLDITTVTNPILEFKHKQPLEQGRVDQLMVAYRTSPNENWMVLANYENATNGWETERFVLPNASAEYQIGFNGISHNANGVYVDDVWVGNLVNDGIDETASLVTTVSPNPATDKVLLLANTAEGEVVIFDLFGRILSSTKLHEGHAEVNLDGFAHGVYMARITSDCGSTTIKLVKE